MDRGICLILMNSFMIRECDFLQPNFSPYLSILLFDREKKYDIFWHSNYATKGWFTRATQAQRRMPLALAFASLV